MPSLEFRDVVKAYDGKTRRRRRELRGRSRRGVRAARPNGAGKTTPLRMAMGIVRPNAGTILLDGRPSFEADPDRIGYLPEERGLYRMQRVVDVLEYFGRLEGMTGAAAQSRAREELARAGLSEWEKKRVEHLSKGMQQIVQVIGALLHRPDVVVLDEPFSGLDPVNVRLVKDMIAELRSRGASSSSRPTSWRRSRGCATGSP